MKYVEIAIGTPRNRGVLVVKSQLNKYLRKKEAVYRSTYLYDEEALDHVKATGSIKDYFGTRWVDTILIDIDKKDNSDLKLPDLKPMVPF